MKNFGSFLPSVILATLMSSLPEPRSLAQNLNPDNRLSHQPQQQTLTQDSPGVQASALLGKRVESTAGNKLGSVSDLIIDIRSGRVAYVIISSGGFIGIGRQQKVVPPGAMSLATTKRNTVSLDVTLDRWKSAPIFNRATMARLGNPAPARQIYQYYQQSAPIAETQSSTSPPDRRNHLELASRLRGKAVVDRQGHEIGTISDLLVDLGSPKGAFAILKPGPFITVSNKQAMDQLFAVPINYLNPDGQSDRAILESTPTQFQQAQPLKAGDWDTPVGASASVPKIYRYQPANNNAFNQAAPHHAAIMFATTNLG
ncbi:MAG: antigen [Pedosphaera sp.]|nr:antigen [Pedosphaera sp.]